MTRIRNSLAEQVITDQRHSLRRWDERLLKAPSSGDGSTGPISTWLCMMANCIKKGVSGVFTRPSRKRSSREWKKSAQTSLRVSFFAAAEEDCGMPRNQAVSLKVIILSAIVGCDIIMGHAKLLSKSWMA